MNQQIKVFFFCPSISLYNFVFLFCLRVIDFCWKDLQRQKDIQRERERERGGSLPSDTSLLIWPQQLELGRFNARNSLHVSHMGVVSPTFVESFSAFPGYCQGGELEMEQQGVELELIWAVSGPGGDLNYIYIYISWCWTFLFK